MINKKQISIILSLLISILFLYGCTGAPLGWYEVKVPNKHINSQSQAQANCPDVCRQENGKWSGKWFDDNPQGCICLKKQCEPNCVINPGFNHQVR